MINVSFRFNIINMRKIFSQFDLFILNFMDFVDGLIFKDNIRLMNSLQDLVFSSFLDLSKFFLSFLLNSFKLFQLLILMVDFTNMFFELRDTY